MKLTKLEKDMLYRAAEFALAGEWPWEEKSAYEETSRDRRWRLALESARDKLEKAS